MSDRLIQQLKKVKRIEIPEPPKDFNYVEIPKQVLLSSADIKSGDRLLIELPDYIIHPSGNFDLHKRWNHDTPPVDTLMRVSVIQCMGNMIKVKSVGVNEETLQNNDHVWEGWLPRASIKIKSKY